MKVLPDYLIQYMPELEEALEELRLSVIDHAYELLKCLDIDELSSDDIRHKLELYSIKLENMTSDWLPNGRFYRMYSSIKHHRTRFNAIQSIVKSGGQFEGVWSSDFNEKQQYNYRLIQLLRHYQIQSPMDGYFYISGDATRNANGSISGSTLTALSTDALLSQALPAGYTYIYVPWPRPYYPADSNYFYNVHMLQFDRLHYAEDCSKPYGDNGYVYSTDLPASMQYYNKATAKQPPYWFDYHYIGDSKHQNITGWPIEEIGIYKDGNGNDIAKIEVSKNKYGASSSKMSRPYDSGDSITWELITDDIEKELLNEEAVEYILDKRSKGIADPHAPEISNCYLHTKYRFSEPNRSQIFTPIERSVVFDNYSINDRTSFKNYIIDLFKLSEESADVIIGTDGEYISIPLKIEDCTEDYLSNLKNNLDSHSLESSDDLKFSYKIHEMSIDENCLIEPDLTFSPKAAPYRFDRLTRGLLLRLTESLHHIKTYRPVADVSSPVFAMLQSSFNSTQDAEDEYGWGNSSHSLYHWMHLKQSENRPELADNVQSGYDESYSGIVPNEYYTDSFVGNNKPPVSRETFTSYDRHTNSWLDPIHMALFYPEPNTGHQEVQGDDYTLSNEQTQNKLFYYNESNVVHYDPILSYTIISFGRNGESPFENNISSYLLGNPASVLLNDESKKSLVVSKNGQSHDGSSNYNFITYKTSKIHKLWFSQDKHNTLLNTQSRGILYNDAGSSDHYIFTSELDNVVTLQYTVLGVYDENGNKLDNQLSLQCLIINNEYFLHYNISESFRAAYVLFTVNIIPEPTEIIADTNFNLNLWFNHIAISREIVDLGVVNYEYIEPAIAGGIYNSDNFEIESDIAGGEYNSDNFNVYTPVIGGSYDSDNFNIISDIIGGEYNSDQFSITSDITGGNYSSDNFAIYSDVVGGNYDSDQFAITSDIVGGNYDSDNFNIYSEIIGGSYNSDQFNITSDIVGGSYDSDNFSIISDISGGNYISDNFAIESYISTGGQYVTTALDVAIEDGISGGSYITESLDVNLDTGLNGGSYVTEELDVEQHNE